MDLFTAMTGAAALLKLTLEEAGLKDGITIENENLPTEKGVLFWELKVTNAIAAKKDTYATWNFLSIPTIQYGDGSPLVKAPTISLIIFSNQNRNSEKIALLIQAIDTACINHDWIFDLSGPIEYDTETKMYEYSFILQGVLN